MDGRVIIITPEAPFRDALEMACSGYGCQVETAASASEALDLVDRSPVCVMIADVIGQDDRDGIELAKAIHQQNPDANYFLLADKDCLEARSFAEREPRVHFVQKPVLMLQFSAAVVEAIQVKNAKATSIRPEELKEDVPSVPNE